MFCPKCGAEYRPGFRRCSDCDVDLVERIPEDAPSADDSAIQENTGNVGRVWYGEDQAVCVYICERLRSSKIPFTVEQHNRQFLRGVDELYTIRVPIRFTEAAKKVIGRGRLDFTDQPEDQKLMELPALHDAPIAKPPGGSGRSGRDTSEILCKSIGGRSWMIEASLRENGIDFRAGPLAGGSQKFIVSAADESRAREIIAEIEEGKPPT